MKFPDLSNETNARLNSSPKRTEFTVYEPITLLYRASQAGFATIIDYTSDTHARILVFNRAISPGFEYAYRGEISLPEGDEFIRLVFSRNPISYEAVRSLAEYPLDIDTPIGNVLQEDWLRIRVKDPYRVDPFYRYPRSWQSWRYPDLYYLFAQPYDGAVITGGLKVLNQPRIRQVSSPLGILEVWEVSPGDSLEFAFEGGSFAYSLSDTYMLLFPTSEFSAGNFLGLNESEHALISVSVNNLRLAEANEIPTPFSQLDDAHPLIIRIPSRINPGVNTIEIRNDILSPVPLLLRRLELRRSLEGIIGYEDMTLGFSLR